MAEGGFGRLVDDRTLQYERIYPHPIERVWRAITDPAEFGQWFMAGSLELRSGGAYRFGAGEWTGEVLAATPPTLLRLGGRTAQGGPFMMEYVLEPVAGGVRMLFTTQHGDPPRDLDRHPNGVAGGWHELFDSLGEQLDGVAIGTRLPRTDLAAIAEGWAKAKVEEGAFDAASAARHALDLRREEEVAELNRRYRERRTAGAAGQGDVGLGRFLDRRTLEFVRVYPHPIERVWRAIIEPEEFGVWFIKGRLDPRVGGRFWFGDDGFQGAVTAIEPPRLLCLGDDKSDTFQYELTEVAGGTRMSFIHHIPPGGPYEQKPDPTGDGEASWDLGGDLPGGLDTPWRPGFIGGFHDMHDRLADFLDGVPVGSRLPPTEMSTFIKKWATVPPGMNGSPEEQKKQRMLVYRALRGRERWFELIGAYRDHIKAAIPPATGER